MRQSIFWWREWALLNRADVIYGRIVTPSTIFGLEPVASENRDPLNASNDDLRTRLMPIIAVEPGKADGSGPRIPLRNRES